MLSPDLYAAFWSLSVSDLTTPFAAYAEHKQAQQQALLPIDAALSGSISRDARERLQAEAEAHRRRVTQLDIELQRQSRRAVTVISALKHVKDRFFLESDKDRASLVRPLLQYCVLPRVMLSCIDAVYSAKVRSLRCRRERSVTFAQWRD